MFAWVREYCKKEMGIISCEIRSIRELNRYPQGLPKNYHFLHEQRLPGLVERFRFFAMLLGKCPNEAAEEYSI